jgi:hypothetical protein
MTSWWKGVRTTVLAGLAWAVAWAPIAVLIGITIIDPDNSMDEMWPAIGAYPGFFCGVVFCSLLGIVDRHHRLAETALPRPFVLGAVGGLLVGVLPFMIGTANPESPDWLPAAGQGTIAVQIRAADASVRAMVSRLNDSATEIATRAERGFLAALEGGCQVPIGALAVDSELHGFISSVDGRYSLRGHIPLDRGDPERSGRELAERLRIGTS